MRSMGMIIQRLAGVVAAVVLFAAGAMSMEVESPAGVDDSVSNPVTRELERLEPIEDNPVRYWIINRSNMPVMVKIDLCDLDIKVYTEVNKNVINYSVSSLRKNEIFGVETDLEHYNQGSSDYHHPKIEFHKCDYAIFSRYSVFRLDLEQGSLAISSASSRPMRLLPFGSCFVIEPNFSNVRHLSFNDCFSEFYEKIKYVLTNDDSCPFALLPLELRWKIGFNILGVFAPFDR